MSNGGYMSILLACQLSHRIAAVAAIAGSMSFHTFNSCNPQHPTPLMQIHGTADGFVPHNGTYFGRSQLMLFFNIGLLSIIVAQQLQP